MRYIFQALMGLGQGLSGLHFNVKLAIIALLICFLHTVVVFYFLIHKEIDSDVGQLVLEFSMSGTLFILLGICIKVKRSKNVNSGNCGKCSGVPPEVDPMGSGNSGDTGGSGNDIIP